MALLARVLMGGLGVSSATMVLAAQPVVKSEDGVTVATFGHPPGQAQSSVAAIDYVNARVLDLPIAYNYSAELAQNDLIASLTSPTTRGPGGISRGASGDGKTNPVFLGAPAAYSGGYEPQDFGTSNHPFNTARADAFSGSTNQLYPFRAAGKLFFNEGASTFICSASLIAPGIVVTAAHCVSDFGKKNFHTNFNFVPGYKSGSAPYGVWTVHQVRLLNAYFAGTDTCSQRGVVCQDDVALLVLNSQNGRFAGSSTGWYGYAWNGAGFTSANLTQVTQIGYPACLDNGEIMERNDSYGFKSASNANNTLIGSLMCGGSSGGPWLANFGAPPSLTGTTAGAFANPNIVIGVTSWGATSTGPKQQGASPFLSTNIAALVGGACKDFPANCR
ncbi:MAG: trypsin-like serine protease [Steroidobacteraceae bacterium]